MVPMRSKKQKEFKMGPQNSKLAEFKMGPQNSKLAESSKWVNGIQTGKWSRKLHKGREFKKGVRSVQKSKEFKLFQGVQKSRVKIIQKTLKMQRIQNNSTVQEGKKFKKAKNSK